MLALQARLWRYAVNSGTFIMRAPLVATLLALTLAVPVHADPPKLAVFDFELLDTSLQGQINGSRKDERERLVRAGEQLRKELAASGKFELLDILSVQAAAQ